MTVKGAGVEAEVREGLPVMMVWSELGVGYRRRTCCWPRRLRLRREERERTGGGKGWGGTCQA